MLRYLSYIQFFVLLALEANAYGSVDSINLIKNGDFELGNDNFSSDYEYNSFALKPGEYSITRNSNKLNPDITNPTYGDHTSGDGYFLISNANDQEGMVVWKTKVKVKANSYYRFSVYFCNLYGKKATKVELLLSNFQLGSVIKGNDPNLKITINKTPILQDERDIFHMFRWIKAESIWYSGKKSGEVEICIENLNSRSEGNDLALDDIGFYLTETMPENYTIPFNQTEMSAEYRMAEKEKYTVDPRKIIAINQLSKGDSISPGIHLIKQTQYTIPNFDSENEKFRNILFEQAKSEFSKEAIDLMDQLIIYLNKHPQIQVKLMGHTDNVGNPDLNLKLSEERALLVKEYLIKNKISAERVEIQSFGGALPIEMSTNEELYKLNRRVEIELIKP